ncbi:MAG: YihY/virulence factor BrkB family protein [Tepidisphaeraceae bacterium]|jgi:membrane protein
MASLLDIPIAVRKVGLLPLLRSIARETSDDNIVMLASALAYSWLFAIFPFLIFLLSLLPYLPDAAKDAVISEMTRWVYNDVVPRQLGDTVWQNVTSLLSRPQHALLSVGLVLTLLSASGGINTTISAIERCYDLPEGRPFYKQRPLAILLTLLVSFLILSLLLVIPVGTVAIHWIERHGSTLVSAPIFLFWKAVRYPLGLLLMFAVLHLLYHYGPSIRQKRVYVSPGAVFCVAVWLLLGLVFRLYVDRFGKYNETYGTVGGVAILLLFFYIDSLVLLVGAEINSEIDFAVLGVPRGQCDFTRPWRSDIPLSTPDGVE